MAESFDHLPDPHVVVSRSGRVLAGNADGRRLLRPDHPLLAMLATSHVLPARCRLLDGEEMAPFDLAWRDVHWEGQPARVLRFAPAPGPLPTPAGGEEHVAMLEGLLDALPSLVVLLDADGRIAEANARWHVQAQVGGLDLTFSREGADYLAVCDKAAADGDTDAAVVATGIREVLAGRAFSFEHEYEFAVPDGGVRSYRLTAHALGGAGGAVVQHVQTTALREEQRRHNEAYARFAAVFEFALDAILLLDEDGRCVSANAAAGRLFGRMREGLAGATLAELLGAPDAVSAFWDALTRDGEHRATLPFVGPDGAMRTADVAARSRIVAGEHLVVLRDVTEARALEEQLRQSQKLQAIGELTGGIAHDFNNLLTVILANAELMGGDGEAPLDAAALEDARRSVREVVAAARRGRDMVRKLLGFGRQERLLLGTHRVEHLTAEICETLRRVLPETITLRHHADPELPPVRVDPNALHHMLLNLATNARDAMREGGRLEVCVARGPDGRDVQVTVRDSGSGMTPETADRVFEPFFTTKPVGEGTGLGLPMVYGLMQQMGGDVSLESRPGSGTAVRLRFPVAGPAGAPCDAAARDDGDTVRARSEASPEPAPRRGAAFADAPASVLLVEDDPSIRRLAERILGSRGYEVRVAVDGVDAERQLREAADRGDPPSLVLSDLVMPNGGGQAVAQAIERWAPATPVAWMTGYAFGHAEREGTAYARRPGPVLTKPWTIEALLRTVRDALPPTVAVPTPARTPVVESSR